MLHKVVRSTIIDAPIERVWAVLRDFNSHDQWHDVVASSRIEGNDRSDQVGCIRNFSLKDGNRIREQLIALSDADYKSTYCIVEATVPLQRYVATITLKPVTDASRTFWHWESTFSTPHGMERELHDMVAQGVYEAGFENLRKFLRHGGDLRGSGQSTMPIAMSVPARVVGLRQYGTADVMQASNSQAAAPGDGQVRIAQRAIGVNYLDIYLRRGWIPSMLPLSANAPSVLGMEASGIVLDVGTNVKHLLPGDRVVYMGPQPGAYASVRTVPADWVVQLPPQVEHDTAAAILLKGITADFLLRDLGQVRAGTRLLVHAAAGGVGLLVCAWARSLGATVIGTVSSEEKARVARAHGCEHVIITRDYQFAETVQQLHGGADVVIDGLGDAARSENLQALAHRGHWISLGQATGAMAAISPDLLVAKSLSFSRPLAFAYVATQQQMDDRANRVWGALASGIIKPPLIERYTLEAAAQAHTRLESRASIGSLILTA